ncbi:MAG: exodeoxyribonuclease VII small subunit [Deferribacteres bacterium]|nr:exodeoxyribonuclease VII small subunit [candidate division KSB1 bacterium]MCB9501495.1 exodeoxyribonuclease VII small subunit [Deferribacteres bacterium]
MAAKESFEKTLRRLQEIVEILEQGQSGLDESIQVFEEGLQLVQKCNKQLDSAEGKLRKLIKTEDGLQLSFLDSEKF